VVILSLSSAVRSIPESTAAMACAMAHIGSMPFIHCICFSIRSLDAGCDPSIFESAITVRQNASSIASRLPYGERGYVRTFFWASAKFARRDLYITRYLPSTSVRESSVNKIGP